MPLLTPLLASLRAKQAHNLHTLRTNPLAELSGALGDLGTLLPLTLALAQQSSISLPATLVVGGLANAATGALFAVPLPVQPMKAIAAQALSDSRAAAGGDMATVTAAGAWVALVVGLLAASGGLRWLARAVPVPVVKGIQLGAGVQIVLTARRGMGGGGAGAERAAAEAVFALLGVVLIAVFVLASGRGRSGKSSRPALPFALVVCLAGAAWAVARAGAPERWLALWRPRVHVPAWFGGGGRDGQWAAVAGMALGQLPLTTLNSVIAVSALAADLLPETPAPSVTALGLSVAAMNLAGCWLGAMPMCHGAGGLAAQWRFGARSGASVVVLGAAKVLLGLLFGDSLMAVIERFPAPVLGVMVLGAGLELARVAAGVNEDAMDLWEEDGEGEEFEEDAVVLRRRRRELGDEERTERWLVMLVTMAGLVAFHNDAVGFVAGMLCYWFYRLAAWWERRGARGQLHI